MPLPGFISRFARSEDGWISILSIYFVMIAAIMGGLAIDYQNRETRHTKLQTAADAVAHAALYSRSIGKTASESKLIALDIAANTLPASVHGDAITVNDIEFGNWDEDTSVFTAAPNAVDAVRVSAKRNVARDNIVHNLILDMVGYSGWEVEVEATFQIWFPPCFQNGFNAEGIVDTQSNNVFGADFCMHANDHVALSSNNTFYAGSVVSMPDIADLSLPSSGMDSNLGLAAALRNSWYQFKVLDEMAQANTSLRAGTAAYTPDYINGSATVLMSLTGNKKVDASNFTPGRIHILDCSTGGNTVTFEKDNYSEFVLVTDCAVNFQNNSVLEDVVIYSESQSAKAFSASHVTLGKNDNCAAGGGVTLLTDGGFDAASDLQIYGSQIIAKGDIEFAAQATGVQGVSMVAGGDLDTTSNVQMNGCPQQIDENLLVEKVIRMVN